MIYDRAALVDTVVYHWRTDNAGCGCGWAVLGASHAEHVADVYEQVVSLREAAAAHYWSTRPHCRACGIHVHEHGPSCHPNCPTCGGTK